MRAERVNGARKPLLLLNQSAAAGIRKLHTRAGMIIVRGVGPGHDKPISQTMKIITLTLAALISLILSSCNTMEGVGRDMQKAGNALENSANR
jgi:predicted small secreted protein